MSEADYKGIEIEATLPKPWEEETTFNDVLYDWMGRAPWLAISVAAHLLVFIIVQSIPWGAFGGDDETSFEATTVKAPEEELEEPEEEIEEEIEEEPIEEPVLKDAEVSDHNETDDNQEFESSEGDPDFNSDSPFDSDNLNDVIGIGGGAGGKFGGRLGGSRNLRAGGSGTEQALKDGLEWLKNHQNPDGSWDADGFETHCPAGQDCGDPGHATHDVGLTGLALLAFLGDGHTESQGAYIDVVKRGIQWLKEQQDRDNGLIGEDSSNEFIYDHAIATLAICEAYYFSKSPRLKSTAQKAINYIARARYQYGAWRYDVPSNGDGDTSVTGWMVFALTSAKEAGLTVDPTAVEGALAFIDEMTDPVTGRVGYNSVGSVSSRTSTNEHFPPDKGEGMTAVGLLCRFFLDQDPKDFPIMKKHAALLEATLPEWDPDGFGCDMYYWYYGSYALFQMGGEGWKKWNKAMKAAVVDSQCKEAHKKGSWDPVGPWGYSGGRVYSTATMVLCLEVYFRYGRVLGAR
ncbi:MAG: hypothetical protein ACI8QS_001491 [Planctomycetota bacterium]|jgi:hypothetical protein